MEPEADEDESVGFNDSAQAPRLGDSKLSASLSDRTVESLTRVPPSPAGRRRRSSFFSIGSPTGPASKPASRPSSSLSNSNQQGTCDGSSVDRWYRLGSDTKPVGTPTHEARTSSSQAEQPQDQVRKVSNSSAALREQIARAKALRKSPSTTKTNGGFGPTEASDSALPADPFNQVPRVGKGVLRKRVGSARADGRLNISALGLSEIPQEVLNMYDFDPSDNSFAWNEAVDLVRLLAADNELETISDELFPDIDPYEMNLNDDSKGPQFAGIELLDLHGNLLRTVPVGLRQLKGLTTLNLVSASPQAEPTNVC